MQPEVVNGILQNYDIMLRVAYRPSVSKWAVERRMHNTPNHKIEPLKKLLHNRANRAIPEGLKADQEAQLLLSRKDSRARLDAMNDGYRPLFFVDDLSETTVGHIMATLKATDLWSHQGYKQGDTGGSADRIAGQMDYEQDREQERVAAAHRDELANRAYEAFYHAAYKSGKRISMAGVL